MPRPLRFTATLAFLSMATGACSSSAAEPAKEGKRWLVALQASVAQGDADRVTELVVDEGDARILPGVLLQSRKDVRALTFVHERRTDDRIVCLAATPWNGLVEFPLVRDGGRWKLEGPWKGKIRLPALHEIPDHVVTPGIHRHEEPWPGTWFVVRAPAEVATPADRLVAFADVCTYRGSSLVLTEGREFRCPGCGSRFAVDGAVLAGPAETPLRRLTVVHDQRGRSFVLRDDPPGWRRMLDGVKRD